MNKIAIIATIIAFIFLGPIRAEDKPLVRLTDLSGNFLIDLKYKTDDNFMKEVLYPKNADAYLRPDAAAALKLVSEDLLEKKLKLKIFDAYRPLSVQKKMWAKFPMEGYVANPAKGSNHNRGAAVDLTLVDWTGKELEMPSAYDEFSKRAHQDYEDCSEHQKKNRQLLREAMEKRGFKSIRTEWWHFDFKDAKSYPVLDVSFEDKLSISSS